MTSLRHMLEIFQYDFMERAFAAGIMIGVIAPIIGVFLVVKRYSLLADTLSHVSLVGLAAGVLLHFNPFIGAFMSSCLAAIGIERLRQMRSVVGESVLALFLSGSLATALIIFALANGLNTNIFSYLFGSIATVSRGDLLVMAAAGTMVVAFSLFFFKKFFLISYDEELAKASGLPVQMLSMTLMILAATVISLALRAVGALLVGALMVIPVLTAMQWGTSFRKTSIYAVCLSTVAVIKGLFLSFYLDIPSGAAIVAVTILFFVLSLLATKRRFS